MKLVCSLGAFTCLMGLSSFAEGTPPVTYKGSDPLSEVNIGEMKPQPTTGAKTRSVTQNKKNGGFVYTESDTNGINRTVTGDGSGNIVVSGSNPNGSSWTRSVTVTQNRNGTYTISGRGLTFDNSSAEVVYNVTPNYNSKLNVTTYTITDSSGNTIAEKTVKGNGVDVSGNILSILDAVDSSKVSAPLGKKAE